MIGVTCTAGLADTSMGLAKSPGTRTDESCESPGLANIEEEGKPCAFIVYVLYSHK